MPKIQQLDPAVVAQIAAGEVIERPASVVKELLENSIDAGSTRIDIELEQGGTELIRIVDNGCGIAADDLPLAFSSHATSKLKQAADLFEIATMGFRGEALASIGGIAKVVLQSRPQEQSTGAEIRCDAGVLSPVKAWNGAPGTRIEIRHLFYSVPVRKKFLKAIATEQGHVSEAVTRLALSRPDLHITLKHNGKQVHDIPATMNLPERIGHFFGVEVKDAMYMLDPVPGSATLAGFVGDPACDRGTAKMQYLYVNGRWIRDRSLSHAFADAYRGLIMTGRYPIGFLFLSLPPDVVDVNVHPTKAEVRFRDSSMVYSLIRSTVKARLLKENLVPKLEVPQLEQSWQAPPPREPWSPPLRETLFSPRRELVDTPAPWEVVTPNVERQSTVSERQSTVSERQPVVSDEPEFREVAETMANIPVGSALQVHDAYLVLESDNGMLVIDQHALHERILYEQLRTRVRDGKLEVQRLLIPEPLELTSEQAAIVLEFQEQLADLGLGCQWRRQQHDSAFELSDVVESPTAT